jgi:hypothetical protein
MRNGEKAGVNRNGKDPAHARGSIPSWLLPFTVLDPNVPEHRREKHMEKKISHLLTIQRDAEHFGAEGTAAGAAAAVEKARLVLHEIRRGR